MLMEHFVQVPELYDMYTDTLLRQNSGIYSPNGMYSHILSLSVIIIIVNQLAEKK